MRKRLRLLLACFLALALPVQGALAITTAQCMALGHHGGDSIAVHEHAHDGHEGNEHAAHSHSDALQLQASDGSDGDAAHCGPCTACCASASIAGTFGIAVANTPNAASFVFPPLPPLSLLPSGLDRPPHPL